MWVQRPVQEDRGGIAGLTSEEFGKTFACVRVPQPDAQFEHVVSLIRKGVFGWADFFEPLVDSVTTGADYYLLANDFPSYIAAQARFPPLACAVRARPALQVAR